MIGKVITKQTIKQYTKCVRCVSATTAVSDFKEIPTAKGLPVIGTTLSLLAAGSAPKLHKYADARHKQLGPIFKDKIGPVSAVFISNPEEMRSVFMQEGKYPTHVLPDAWVEYNKLHGCSRGLFFMDGEEWLQNRRIMNKLLLKGDFKWIEDACKEVTKDLIERIMLVSKQNDIFPNLESQLYRWSLDVIVSVLIGADLYRQYKVQLEPYLAQLASIVHLVFDTTARLTLIPASIAANFRIKRWKRFEKSVDDALAAANNLVVKLLYELPEGNGLLFKMQHENMQEVIIKRIVADLILAAGDTTAYSLQWILYLLAKNHDIQKHLYQELHLEPHPQLLKNIIRESLRLYPIATFLTRFLPQDTIISGYNVPKNTLIILSVYSSSRDPKYFDNPDLFNPDRWLRDSASNTAIMQQASLPFAIGSRSCIGKKIADIQLQTALAELISKFDIRLKNTEEIEMILMMVAVPSKPVMLKFIQR